MARLLASLALSVSCLAVSGTAQADSLTLTPSRLEVRSPAQAQSELADLRRDYDQVRLRGPRIGLGVSSVLAVGAIFPMGIGFAYNRSCELEPGNPTVCREPFGTGLAAFGTVVMASGIAGLIVSAIRLKKKKDERRRLRWQILALEGTQPVAAQ